MPFSFVCEAQHWLSIDIPDIQLPVNGVTRNFPYFLITGTSRSVSLMMADTSGGGCSLIFCRDINETRMLPGTTYSTDYILSISFALF